MDWFNTSIRNQFAAVVVSGNLIIVIMIVFLVRSLAGNMVEYQDLLANEINYERENNVVHSLFNDVVQEWQLIVELEPSQASVRNERWDTLNELTQSTADKSRQLSDQLNRDNKVPKQISETLNQFTQQFAQLDKELKEKYQAQLNGADDSTMAIRTGEMNKQLSFVTDQLIEISTQKSIALEENSWNLIKVVRVIIILAIIAIVLVIIFVVNKRIISPIEKLARRIKTMGQRDFAEPIAVDSEDEVGRLAGDLEITRHEVSQAMSEIIKASEDLSNASNQVNELAGIQEAHTGETQSNLDQSSVAVNEMSATVISIAESAQGAAEAANNADSFANVGVEVMNQTITAMNELSEDINQTAQLMEKLDTETTNVGSVLEVIKGIAEQTNLLALNAAIEAARAGEQGRGFAVVADEVRGLAQRTQESTQEIQHIIETLQTGSGNAAVAMRHGLEKTQKTVELTSKAGEAIDDITQAVSSIRDMNTQIATASEEQSVVAEQINKNINQVAELANKTYDGAKETNALADDVEDIAKTMQTMAKKFKVE